MVVHEWSFMNGHPCFALAWTIAVIVKSQIHDFLNKNRVFSRVNAHIHLFRGSLPRLFCGSPAAILHIFSDADKFVDVEMRQNYFEERLQLLSCPGDAS